MKKKKTVTLPRVFHPGPGHPAETLAYLNPAEHELIRQLTDGTASRGPKGVKSYSVTTGTTTNSTSSGSGSGSNDKRGGPGGGSLSAPARTAPSSSTATSSPNSKVSTGGTTPANNPTGGALQAPARTAASVGNVTALGQVAKAAQANTSNYPSRGDYGGATPSYARDMGSAFNTLTGSLGQPSTPNWSNDRTTFDRWGTGAVGNLYGRNPGDVSEMARTIAGEAANQSPDQRAAVANVMNNRLGLGYGYLGGGTVGGMLRGFDANGYDRNRVGGANSAYSDAKPGTENFTNGLSAMVDAANPASSFRQSAPAGVLNATHYYNPSTASPSWANTPEFQGTRTAFGDHVFGNPENTASMVAGLGSAGLGQAAALDKAKVAATAAAAMQNLGPVQGPQRYSAPLAGIPAPSSMGMLPQAPNISPASAPPRNPVGGMSFTPGLPAQMPQAPDVRTDPRVGLTPLGSLPAAKPVEVAWNVPPMGGAVPSPYGDLFGTWGTNRPAPPDPNGGATPGTIHSQTASAAPPAAANTSGWSWGNLYQTASTGVQSAKKAVQTYQDNPAVQKINQIAKTNPGLAGALVNMAMGLGGGHTGSNGLGNDQDRSRFMQQAPQRQQTAGNGGSAPTDPLTALQSLQANMVAQGATPEELAYIQSIIDELSQTQVA